MGNIENYLNEARRMGVVILPPDVNLSQYEYKGKVMEIRTGLQQLKNVKKKTIDKILSERALGPFLSMEDFFPVV